LLPACLVQFVEAGTPPEFGNAPFGIDPALVFEAVQSGIERALIDLQDLPRDLLNALGDCPAVHGFGLQRAQNEEIERALQEIETGALRHSVECLQKR